MDIDSLMETRDMIDVSEIITGNEHIILRRRGLESNYYGAPFYCPDAINISEIIKHIETKNICEFTPIYFLVFIDLSYKLKKRLKQRNYNIIIDCLSSYWSSVLNYIIIGNDLGIMIINKKYAFCDTVLIESLKRIRFIKKIL